MAHGLSVAQAAALINAAFTIAKFSFPMLTSIIAIRSLKSQPNAATWSVFGRLINESLWPKFLSTDTASPRRVQKRITALAVASTAVAWILAVSVAITPLGLHETTILKQEDNALFVHAVDESAINQATRSRAAYMANRRCGSLLAVSCPGNTDNHTITVGNRTVWAGVGNQDLMSTTIADNITDAFSAATRAGGSTIAGVFDIQWRSYLNYNNATNPGNSEPWFDEGRPRTTDSFRFSQNFATQDLIQLVNGLIVSTLSDGTRGIGFRNHTIPLGSADQLGHRWEEHILWLAPETHCTNLNLSYDVSIPGPNSSRLDRQRMRVTDHGGLFDRDENYRILTLNDTQDDPKLQGRSWNAAVYTNRLLKSLLNEGYNEDHEHEPKEYPLDKYTPSELSSDQRELRQISLSRFGEFSKYYGPAPNLPLDMSMLNSRTPANKSWTESWANISSSLKNIESIDSHVLGWSGVLTNISQAGAVGGLLLGPGRRIDAGSLAEQPAAIDSHVEPGSNWTQPLYACVSAIKASVKKVRFSTNGTTIHGRLSDIQVESIIASDMPVTWGVENSGRTASWIQPLWGIVSPDASQTHDVFTLQRPELYLPTGSDSVFFTEFERGGDAAAGAKAPFQALGTIYSFDFPDSFPTLTGYANWPIAQKWAQLSRNASSVGDIINLLWVELMANAVVGTKSVLSQPDGPDLEMVTMPAWYYERSLAYDWIYAIPALIFATIYLAALILSLVLAIPKRLSFDDIRFMLNQSAAVRTMTTERFKNDGDRARAKTKKWVEELGDEIVQLPAQLKDAAAKQEQSLLSPTVAA